MAPSLPQRIAATSVRTALAMSCQRRTMRKGPAILEAKPFNYSGRATGASKIWCTAASTAGDALHQALELVEARIFDDDGPMAIGARLQVHRGTQAFGELLLEAPPVRIEPGGGALRRPRRRGRILHQAFGLAHRQALCGDALGDFDLSRLRKR